MRVRYRGRVEAVSRQDNAKMGGRVRHESKTVNSGWMYVLQDFAIFTVLSAVVEKFWSV